MTHTGARVWQWLGIITILCLFGGAYWYFQVRASTLNQSQNDLNTNGLVGMWSFNGDDVSGTTAYDRSGSGNNGTLTNGPVKTDGKVGQALDFFPNGSDTNAYVTMGDPVSGALDFGTGDFSVGFWMKGRGYSNQGSSRNVALCKKSIENFENAGYCFLYGSDNKMMLDLANGTSGAELVESVATAGSNSWNYYFATRSSNQVSLFVNGQVVATTTLAGSVSSSSAYAVGSDTVNERNTNAIIDEVRVYNRAITVSEVASLYALGQSDKVNSSVSQPQGTGRLDSGLAGYWKMDDGSGTSATDSSTNAYTGTLTSGPTWTTGQIGGAVQFDGVDDYIDTDNSTGLDNLEELSYSAWVYPTSPDGFLLGKRTNGGGTEGFRLTSGTLQGWVANYSGASSGRATSTTTVSLNTWSLVTLTYSKAGDNKPHLYINGGEVAYSEQDTLLGSDPDDQYDFFVGRVQSNPELSDVPYTGKIDEVRIYSRALSADEVSQLYRLNAPTGVDTSLKGYWSFNGKDISGTTVYDRSGAGNTGTLTNGPAVTEGKSGQGIDFWPNGSDTNAYVTMGDPTSGVLDFGTGDFSVGFWMKGSGYSGQGSAANVALAKKNFVTFTASGYGFWYGSSNLMSFTMANGTTAYSATQTVSTVADNQWHHYVGTRSGTSTITLYVDGIQVNNNATASGSVSNSVDFIMGTDSSVAPNDRNADAVIDEVRVYSKALSTTEIKGLYDTGQSDKVNSSVSQPQGTGRLDSGLAGYWKLDDGSGTSATDASTNANTGTLTNGPTWTTGRIGGAVDLDGTDDYINLSTTHNYTSSDFTISHWAKFDSLTTEVGGQGPVTIYKGAYQVNGYYAQVSTVGVVSFFTNQSGANQTSSTPTGTIVTGNWYHMTYVRKGASVRIYINGVDSTTTVGTHSNPSSSSSNFEFGRYAPANIEMNGQVDELRVYDYALFADEVVQLYRLSVPTGTDTSLKGYWSFNGKDMSGTTAFDRSGAGNTGTLTNGPAITEGKLGQALQFDGINDSVAVADPVSEVLDFGTGDFSASAWIKTTESDVQNCIISKAPSSSGFRFGFGGSGLPYYLIGDGTTYKETHMGTSGVLNDGSWHHLVINYLNSTDTINAYVDGAFFATDTFYSSIGSISNTQPLRIGAMNVTFGGTFAGSVDEVRVYNRALTTTEIASLYNSSR